MVNRITNATANSIGVSNVSEPCHMVLTQLNTFTPSRDGDQQVAYMKNNRPLTSGMPTTNMWCAHTMNDRNAIDAVA